MKETEKKLPRQEGIERAIEKFFEREAQYAAQGGDRRTADKARTIARRHGRAGKRGDRS